VAELADRGGTAQGRAELADRVAALMPELEAELMRLAAIPSISAPGYPREPLQEAHDAVAEAFRAAGVEVETLELPDTAPIVTAEVQGPPGAPTVLLYAHYDVQPPGDEAAWRTPPFEPRLSDGTIYGRGVADDKANVIMHLGALRAFDGRPPVGVKVVIEGQEEVGSPFDELPLRDPDRFRADAIVVGDAGNARPGLPTLTVAARGVADVVIEASTLDAPAHSGDFGGAAPDALLALVHALASLHDERGDVAVRGLRREPWTGDDLDEAEFRELAGVPDGVPLMGSGSLGERVWSGPAITVTGLDAPPVEGSPSAVVAHARARLNLRVHPGQDASLARALVLEHLRRLRPFGVALRARADGDAGNGFEADTRGLAYDAARAALRSAWGSEPIERAIGGAIPFVSALSKALPASEILLFGAQDARCGMHAPNERVLLDELERAIVAEAEFFAQYAARKEGHSNG